MDRRYAYEGLKELVTKTSVSELKKAQMDLDFAGELFPEKEIVPYIPAFMLEEQGMSGADRGSAYHRVMELLDFEKVLEAKAKTWEQEQEELERQIALMVEKELLQKPWSEAVSVKKLVIFFQSSLTWNRHFLYAIPYALRYRLVSSSATSGFPHLAQRNR